MDDELFSPALFRQVNAPLGQGLANAHALRVRMHYKQSEPGSVLLVAYRSIGALLSHVRKTDNAP